MKEELVIKVDQKQEEEKDKDKEKDMKIDSVI